MTTEHWHDNEKKEKLFLYHLCYTNDRTLYLKGHMKVSELQRKNNELFLLIINSGYKNERYDIRLFCRLPL
jgi:hypothetical protein